MTDGVTLMDTKATVATVRVVEPVIDPDVAVMLAVPAATLVDRPELLMVATPAADELQVTEVVMS